jgi:deoxyxylulose-5-phosphate synthase
MREIFESVRKTGRLAVIEDAVSSGSVGEKITSELLLSGISVKNTMLRNLGSMFVTHGSTEMLMHHLKLDAAGIAEDIMKTMFGGSI